ncbi:hypothetical protein ASE11_17695 [Hydrogenophaga sp. Root209]|uniref:DUF1173 domain-containing protein n=1 Tax=Hydrogenophaga sp. Root209 TaxID=1736490 RepID=UPI0006F1D0C0|nr:DUF1173 domain-containing protein [Hydrogenophaga sp. Root209]KRB96404.1 hypothetical protein ASE11_17695 [Hydrogenophaga sp. Root209]
MDSPPVPAPAYQIGGQPWDRTMPDFPEAIAKAHAHHLRPRCLCKPGAPGAEMYVARLSDGFVIKRMPNTGWQHATDCTSYEPPADFSGLGPLVGSAIVENPVTGVTSLRLDFPMTKLPGRHMQPAAGSSSSSVASQGQRLGLRALLHYLWDQAELTHWKPGFAGRRNWATVRRHLLQAAENKTTHGQPLLASLYIPEVFSVEQRNAIQTRRQRLWARSAPRHGQPQPLLLMVAEVKEIAPARFGHKAVIKHLPDQAFALDDALYRRLGRCFECELSLWSTEPDLHLLMVATIRVDEAGTPCIVEMSLMLTTSQWLPVNDGWDRQLVEALVRQGRSFVKGLRYNMQGDQSLVCASLLDCGAKPCPLFIDHEHNLDTRLPADRSVLPPDSSGAAWRWNPVLSDMPALPRRQFNAQPSASPEPVEVE